MMKVSRKPITIIVFLLVAAWTLPVSGGAAPSRAARCEALIGVAHDALEQAASESHSTADSARAMRSFEIAFEECGEPRTLPLDVGTEVAAEYARFLRVFQKQPDKAVEVLEEALEWSAERGGLRHPSRVELLQGLAEAVHDRGVAKKSDQGIGEASARGRELLEEALAVREEAFGVESMEAAEGHVRLAAALLDEHPMSAEAHARRAIEIASAAASHSPRLAEALGMLDVALRRQGRVEEANEVTERLAAVLHALDEGNPVQP